MRVVFLISSGFSVAIGDLTVGDDVEGLVGTIVDGLETVVVDVGETVVNLVFGVV